MRDIARRVDIFHFCQNFCENFSFIDECYLFEYNESLEKHRSFVYRQLSSDMCFSFSFVDKL